MAVQVFSGRLSVDPRRLELHQQHLRHLFGDYQLLSVTTSSRPVTLAALAVPPLTRGFLKPQGRFLATPFHGQALTCSRQAMLAPASMSTEAGWNRRFWAIHGWGTWGRPQSMACSLRLTMPYHALPCLSSHCGQSCWDDLKCPMMSNEHQIHQWMPQISANAAAVCYVTIVLSKSLMRLSRSHTPVLSLPNLSWGWNPRMVALPVSTWSGHMAMSFSCCCLHAFQCGSKGGPSTLHHFFSTGRKSGWPSPKSQISSHRTCLIFPPSNSFWETTASSLDSILLLA